MRWVWRSWDELTREELYDLLTLRSQVFVVEQGDPFLDPDGWDRKAMHLLGYDDGALVAYSRLILPGIKRAEAILSRACVAVSHRKRGLGDIMVSERLKFLKDNRPGCDVCTSVQTYRRPKYETLGFVAIGEPYLDGRIMHIDMVLKGAGT